MCCIVEATYSYSLEILSQHQIWLHCHPTEKRITNVDELIWLTINSSKLTYEVKTYQVLHAVCSG